ncbi:MAG TPA: sulfite exporter TauE/SafE family protein [Acidimicrobiales bacterium]|nr:sulfite exporter TauE/SafE family protein [Acidimicrobiales bacterium]
MSPLHALAIGGAGLVAGMMNVVVGAGSFVTFPVLLALGYPPVQANVTNTIGLVFGSASGVVAYRRELAGQRSRLVTLGIASAFGGLVGAALLLALAPSVFRHVVPFLILGASILVLLGPRLSRAVETRPHRHTHGGAALFVGVLATGIYGGYFGAAQGIILLALLGTFLVDHLQRLNAAKNVLALVVNGVAAVFFAVRAHVAWPAAAAIAVGSVIGGQIGGVLGRRLPAPVLRLVVVLVGLTVSVVLFV